MVTDQSSKENSSYSSIMAALLPILKMIRTAVLSEVEGGGLLLVAYVWRNTP